MVAETKMAETAVNPRRRMASAPYLQVAAEARAAAFTQLLPIVFVFANRCRSMFWAIGRMGYER
jgi:hypothetical protein